MTSPVRGVVDLYDVTDDWIPIYDKSDLPGFYMAVGTSGNQFKNAPVVGAMMAELIIACERGHDHDRDPLPFPLPRAGRTLSLGFFSRRRRVSPESSFSVLGVSGLDGFIVLALPNWRLRALRGGDDAPISTVS